MIGIIVLTILCLTTTAITFILCAYNSNSWIFDSDYYENQRLRKQIKELEDKLEKQNGFFK